MPEVLFDKCLLNLIFFYITLEIITTRKNILRIFVSLFLINISPSNNIFEIAFVREVSPK